VSLTRARVELDAELRATQVAQDERARVMLEDEQRGRALAQGSAETRREDAVQTLVDVLLARAAAVAIASIEVCALKAELADGQRRLARETSIASASGAMIPSESYNAGAVVVDAGAELAALERAIRQRLGSAPAQCVGNLQTDALCNESPATPCGEGARARLRAFPLVAHVLRGEPLSVLADMERAARSSLDAGGVAEAEARAARLLTAP
jgi:hypothetical protein